MKFLEIAEHLKGIRHTGMARGKQLYEHILKTHPNRCLELGFAHGVSTCYTAAALQECGSGIITSVDLIHTKNLNPNLEQLLAKTGLEKYCEIRREQNSYTWFLKKEIEQSSNNYICAPKFDFCFIDGAKNWTIDGFAFFLVDKLLKVNGWILFDDYEWSYKGYGKELMDGITIRELSPDQAEIPNVRLIFQLLVMQHPNYYNFKIDGNWAWVQKRK